MRAIKLSSFVISMLTALVGCAATTEEISINDRLAEMGYALGEVNPSVRRYRITGWSELDDRHVIINHRSNERYLVELTNNCPGVDTALVVAFPNRTGTSSLSSFDTLLVRGPGRRVQRCRIQSITELLEISQP